MTRLQLVLAVAAASLSLGAARPGCEGQLGPLWGPIMCPRETLAEAWSVMDAAEPATLATERALFDARLKTCTHGRDERRVADREAVFQCLRNRVWARTRALALREDPASFTGRYLWQSGAGRGEVRVLVESPTQVRLDVRTISRARGHVCTFSLYDAWVGENEVAWKGRHDPEHPESECDFSLRRSGEREVRLDATARCAWVCGATGEYRGVYALQP